ncbi:gala protein [Luedemannella helvata]|uniref:Uncharacterized protein n=1 Tax=Luedemannella helvata TaxID=349315 RepID=A0ABN2JS79_9ACTN
MSDPQPVPVRCPAPQTHTGPDHDRELDPLVARLADPAPVPGALTFPRGTLQPDGRLDLCKQALSPLDARRIIPVAARSPHTAHLLLGTNSLGGAGVAALADALGDDHGVRTLYLGCNHIDAPGLAPLLDRLATDRTVRALWLKRNPIGDAGVVAVAEALATNTTVRTLDLTNTGLTVAGLRALADALRGRATPVQRLYLGGNGLGPDAGDLLTALLRDAGVTELYLNAGRLGDAGAASIADALADVDDRRVTLGLGGNGLTPVGVRHLAARLPHLSTLDLARPPSALALAAEPNVVGDDGAAALATALPGSGLRRLDLRHTGVTGRGARLLIDALDAGTDLELLGLGSGVPRRLKRTAAAVLRPVTPAPEDIMAIASVYR